jgi:hypothetical protein
MSVPGVVANLSVLMMVVACGHHPEAAPVAERGHDSTCVQPDSGIALGPDIYQGPRYRVDSSGIVETLPPVPSARTDSTTRSCRDTSARSSSR